jgi:L-alanine-DL-glutamate epimerase-like enolase superfamily enzyme
MEITDVRATTHDVGVDDVPRLDETLSREIVFVAVETDAGITGYGLTSKVQWFGIRALVNREMAPILEGMSPLETERVWDTLQRKLNKRVQTGAWSSAMSAVDIALWDIKGKHYDEPVWRLLGGAQNPLPAYTTMGLLRYDREQLADVARQFVDEGQQGVKMKVGIDDGTNPAEDAARVRAVREAVGDDVDLMIDANYLLPINHAKDLCHRIEDLNITWFEEPVKGNDAQLLRKLGEETSIPIAAGQNEGHRYRHRELIASGAVDIAHPNVVFVGGYTEGKKVASRAQPGTHGSR